MDTGIPEPEPQPCSGSFATDDNIQTASGQCEKTCTGEGKMPLIGGDCPATEVVSPVDSGPLMSRELMYAVLYGDYETRSNA